METTLNIVSIIIIIFGILQIILFFKVWRMTNDVNEIKSKLYESKDEDKEYDLLLISGKYDAAYQILIYKMSKELHDAYQSFNASYYEKEVQRILDIYKPKFKQIGKEIPEDIIKCSSSEYIRTILV